MTMDIHLQITIPDECVTPNVPRIKASFFNRKYRDSQSTPTTPKVAHARIKLTTSTRSRPKQSSTKASGSSRQQNNSPYNSRPSKGRSNTNEPFDPDFSTPRATRNLLTPPSTNGIKLGKRGVTHLIYRPLELDNESSSDSIITKRKRTRTEEGVSEGKSEGKPLLAIEAPRSSDDSLTEFINIAEVEDEVEVNETTSATRQSEVKEQTEAESQVERAVKVVSEESALAERRGGFNDDEEPEIIEVEPDLPDMPAFVPGNCNISEILKLFGKQESSSMRKEKMSSDDTVKQKIKL